MQPLIHRKLVKVGNVFQKAFVFKVFRKCHVLLILLAMGVCLQRIVLLPQLTLCVVIPLSWWPVTRRRTRISLILRLESRFSNLKLKIIQVSFKFSSRNCFFFLKDFIVEGSKLYRF